MRAPDGVIWEAQPASEDLTSDQIKSLTPEQIKTLWAVLLAKQRRLIFQYQDAVTSGEIDAV